MTVELRDDDPAWYLRANHPRTQACVASPERRVLIAGLLRGKPENDAEREAKAGLATAHARGRRGGRPKKLTDPKQLELARTLDDGGQTDIATICAMLGTSRATLFRGLKGEPAER